jgi:hypothetical protein
MVGAVATYGFLATYRVRRRRWSGVSRFAPKTPAALILPVAPWPGLQCDRCVGARSIAAIWTNSCFRRQPALRGVPRSHRSPAERQSAARQDQSFALPANADAPASKGRLAMRDLVRARGDGGQKLALRFFKLHFRYEAGRPDTGCIAGSSLQACPCGCRNSPESRGGRASGQDQSARCGDAGAVAPSHELAYQAIRGAWFVVPASLPAEIGDAIGFEDRASRCHSSLWSRRRVQTARQCGAKDSPFPVVVPAGC